MYRFKYTSSLFSLFTVLPCTEELYLGFGLFWHFHSLNHNKTNYTILSIFNLFIYRAHIYKLSLNEKQTNNYSTQTQHNLALKTKLGFGKRPCLGWLFTVIFSCKSSKSGGNFKQGAIGVDLLLVVSYFLFKYFHFLHICKYWYRSHATAMAEHGVWPHIRLALWNHCH